MATENIDIRTQLPECPLEYEVPLIPGSHTALIISVNAADIDWQEKMLPWTLAGLINNTDLIMKGVHLYIACEKGTEDRIRTALKRFDLPDTTFIEHPKTDFIVFGEHGYAYDSICLFDTNYWAFRGHGSNKDPNIKLPIGHVLRHNWGWGVADYSLHPANDIRLKDAWIPTKHISVTDPDTPESRQKLANYFRDAGTRARWLHDANRAVYGEDYEKKNKTVAGYFFNENGEPNWHLDTSILHYQSHAVVFEPHKEWFTEWRHIGRDALLALHLLRYKDHAYNLQDSLMIEGCQYWNEIQDGKKSYLPQYPRLCNMEFATINGFRHAIKQLMGAQLGMKI